MTKIDEKLNILRQRIIALEEVIKKKDLKKPYYTDNSKLKRQNKETKKDYLTLNLYKNQYLKHYEEIGHKIKYLSAQLDVMHSDKQRFYENKLDDIETQYEAAKWKSSRNIPRQITPDIEKKARYHRRKETCINNAKNKDTNEGQKVLRLLNEKKYGILAVATLFGLMIGGGSFLVDYFALKYSNVTKTNTIAQAGTVTEGATVATAGTAGTSVIPTTVDPTAVSGAAVETVGEVVVDSLMTGIAAAGIALGIFAVIAGISYLATRHHKHKVLEKKVARGKEHKIYQSKNAASVNKLLDKLDKLDEIVEDMDILEKVIVEEQKSNLIASTKAATVEKKKATGNTPSTMSYVEKENNRATSANPALQI